jgi:hypothetical protein
MILANEPPELLLDKVELEAIALGNDRLYVSNAGLPNRIFWCDKVLRDEPDLLMRVRYQLSEVSPATSIGKMNTGARRKMLPPPTRVALRHEVAKRGLVSALCVLAWHATKTLGTKAECLCRSLDVIGVRIHGVRGAASRPHVLSASVERRASLSSFSDALLLRLLNRKPMIVTGMRMILTRTMRTRTPNMKIMSKSGVPFQPGLRISV